MTAPQATAAPSSDVSSINHLGNVVVQIMLVVTSHVILSFGSIVKKSDVEILLIKLGVLAQDLCLGGFCGCFDLLGMLVFEAHLR